jgi:hypothetical protein
VQEHIRQPTLRHKQMRIVQWSSIAIATLLMVAAFLFGTPFVLLAIAHIRPKDWAQLSNEGQAYGGIAAAFGMLALIGVVASLILQSRESAANREFFQRTIHNDLMSRTLDDEALRSCWGPAMYKNDEQERQHIYTNLIFSFWHAMFEVGKLDEHDLRDAAERIFDSAPGRRYWSISGPHRIRFHSSSRRDVRFNQILEQEYMKALARKPALGPSEAASRSPRRIPAKHRSMIRTLIFGAATGALISAFAARARVLSRNFRHSDKGR